MLASGLVAAELDEASLHLSMNVRYVPGERTFFRGIRPPAARPRARGGRRAASRQYPYATSTGPRTRRSIADDWTGGHPPPLRRRGDPAAAVGRARRRLAVRRHRLQLDRGDAPPGATRAPIKTFSLGFDEPTDELDDARFVAETYGTDHHEIVLHEPALKHLRRGHPPHRGAEGQLAAALPAPPLHRRARQGGALGPRRRRALRRLRHLRLPRPDRAAPLRAAPRRRSAALAPALDWTGAPWSRRSGGRSSTSPTRKLEWLAAAGDGARHYLLLRNAWDFNAALLRRVYTPGLPRPADDADPRRASTSYFDGGGSLPGEVLRAEFATKMVSDLLHNEDTMSMAHSVESRVPAARPRARPLRRPHPRPTSASVRA